MVARTKAQMQSWIYDQLFARSLCNFCVLSTSQPNNKQIAQLENSNQTLARLKFEHRWTKSHSRHHSGRRLIRNSHEWDVESNRLNQNPEMGAYDMMA